MVTGSEQSCGAHFQLENHLYFRQCRPAGEREQTDRNTIPGSGPLNKLPTALYLVFTICEMGVISEVYMNSLM